MPVSCSISLIRTDLARIKAESDCRERRMQRGRRKQDLQELKVRIHHSACSLPHPVNPRLTVDLRPLTAPARVQCVHTRWAGCSGLLRCRDGRRHAAALIILSSSLIFIFSFPFMAGNRLQERVATPV